MGSTGSPGNKVEGWAVLTTPARKTLVGRGALTEGHQLWIPFRLLFHSIDYRCKGLVQLAPQTRFEDRDIHAALTPATSCILHTRTAPAEAAEVAGVSAAWMSLTTVYISFCVPLIA